MLSKMATAATVVVMTVLTPFAGAAQNALRDGAGKAIATKACALGSMKAKTATKFVTTMSTEYENVPGTGIKFKQGAGSGCVILQFSSEASTNDSLILRAVLDGGAFIAAPSEVLFARGPSTLTAHAYNFVFVDVPAGPHTAIVQWRVDAGTFGNVARRSTIVQYAP